MKRIKDRFDLDGKVAVITGASKGIGLAIARGLAEFGAQVVISSRKWEGINEAVDSLEAEGIQVVGKVCHVGDPAQCESLIQETVDELGAVDILVNNAAINPHYGPVHTLDMVALQKTMQVNLEAVHRMSNLVYPVMKQHGKGSIINISSIEGLQPGKGMSGYSMSKSALNMLTRSQAHEWGKDGIRVNAIAPGLIKTKFSKALWQNDALMQYVKEHVPAGRAADPEEIAGLAVFLASDASSYCTGGIYLADGGFMLANAL